jgi:hypothetical protein
MTTWADSVQHGDNPFSAMDDDTGTATSLHGQGVVTKEERQALKQNLDKYSADHHLDEHQKSAMRINQCYESFDGGDAGKEAYLEDAAATQLGDVNDPKARLKALSFMTQNTANWGEEQKGENDPKFGGMNCGGASLVGAAYLAEGPEGLAKMMGAMQKFDPATFNSPDFKKDHPEYETLMKRIKAGGKDLTVADIQQLQDISTTALSAHNRKGHEGKENGVSDSALSEFLSDKNGMADMLKDNGMEVEYIQNEGGAKHGDHFVLKIKGQGEGGHDMIYDPKARRGGQVISCEQGVQQYDNATVEHVNAQRTLNDQWKD